MPFLDCHMMVADPYKHVERIGKAVKKGTGTALNNQFTFHVEALFAQAGSIEKVHFSIAVSIYCI